MRIFLLGFFFLVCVGCAGVIPITVLWILAFPDAFHPEDAEVIHVVFLFNLLVLPFFFWLADKLGRQLYRIFDPLPLDEGDQFY